MDGEMKLRWIHHENTQCGYAATDVAQNCILLYCGFAIRWRWRNQTRPQVANALPKAIRRYSRLKICATSAGNAGKNFAQDDKILETKPDISNAT